MIFTKKLTNLIRGIAAAATVFAGSSLQVFGDEPKDNVFHNEFQCMQALASKTIENPYRCSIESHTSKEIPVVIQSIEDDHTLYFFQEDGVYEYQIPKENEDKKKWISITEGLRTEDIELRYSNPGEKRSLLRLSTYYAKRNNGSEKFIVHLNPLRYTKYKEDTLPSDNCKHPSCINMLPTKVEPQKAKILFHEYLSRWVKGMTVGAHKSCVVGVRWVQGIDNQKPNKQLFLEPLEKCKSIPGLEKNVEEQQQYIKQEITQPKPKQTVEEEQPYREVAPVNIPEDRSEPKKSNGWQGI